METGAMERGGTSEVTAEFERALTLFRSGEIKLAHQTAQGMLEHAPDHVGGMMLLLASAAATGDDVAISAALKSISGQYARLLAIPEVRALLDGDLLAPVAATWTFRTVFAPPLRMVQQLEGDDPDRLLARQVQEAIRDAAVDAALRGAPAFRTAPAPRAPSTLHLVDRESEVAVATLHAGRIHLLGRGDDAAVQIDHPSVSRHHLQVEIRDGAWFAQNLSSTNGTFLNGEPLGERWTIVQEGDELRLGDVILDVLASGSPHVSPSPDGRRYVPGSGSRTRSMERALPVSSSMSITTPCR